jgi:peptidoglycan/xylan/chitin deacetylase (PgdA/CDA1 family)
LLIASAVFAVLQFLHRRTITRYKGVLPICRVVTDRPLVALTFDDGPDPAYTPKVLELLRQYHASATFFVLGERAVSQQSLLQRELASGMEIGNHTWSHPNLTTLSVQQAWNEIRRTGDVLGPGTAPLFRAPDSKISFDQLEKLHDVGFESIQGSLALDRYVDRMHLPAAAAARLAGDAHPGDIILAHDAALPSEDRGADRDADMAALRLLLRALERRGLQVTTVGTLLESHGTLLLAKARPWFWQSGFTCS